MTKQLSLLQTSLLLLSLTLIVVSPAGAQSTYWVSKTGSDTNGGTSAADSFLTIQRGVSELAAGDTLNVRAGIYTDDGGASPYAPPVFNGWIDSQPASSNVSVYANGTPGNLITIQAAPGEEGQVTIDGENNRVGIHLQNSDYIRIRGFNIVNSRTQGIASWGQAENEVADPARLSVGVVIENNSIQDTRGRFGDNVSALAMWGSQDWVVRNNYINYAEEQNTDGTFNRLGNGIQSYGVINALVENNYIENVNSGVFWKAHFITDLATRGLVFESEIRYNKIQATGRPIQLLGVTEAGENIIRNNILYGQGGLNDEAGVHVAMSQAPENSGPVRIENNLIDGEGNSFSEGVSIDASRYVSLSGNIIMRTKRDAVYYAWSSAAADGKLPVLNESDYNIYDSSFQIDADRYSGADQPFFTLSAWQAKLASEVMALNVDNPDGNSISQDMTGFFVDLANKDYRNVPGSPALGFMPDGSNAGPYQTGHEVIGLLPNWPMYTQIPEPTSAALSVLAAMGLFARRHRPRRF